MADLPEHIQQILDAAVAAPSGDNSQPWSFKILAPDRIEFRAHPERDNAILNVNSSGTLIALGAAYENASIRAAALGYESELIYMDEPNVLVMKLSARSSDSLRQLAVLSDSIPERHTNRKPYKNMPLTPEDRASVLDSLVSKDGVTCALVEDRSLLAALGRDMTVMEEIALSNQHLHSLFFKGIFWSAQGNEEGQPGLYIKTLELPPPAQLLFKGLRHWKFTNALKSIGFSSKIADTNAKQNAAASAFIFINVQTLDAKSYVEAGRALERVWLTATKRGLSCQIVSGILFLARRIAEGQQDSDAGMFQDEHARKVERAYANLRKAAHDTYHPLIALRIGYAAKATARSRRMKPVIAS